MNAISGAYQQGYDPLQMRQIMQQRTQDNFRAADADGNKALSRSEAKEVMIEKGIDADSFSKIFKKIDTDKNGEISIEEDIQAQIRRHQAMVSEHLDNRTENQSTQPSELEALRAHQAHKAQIHVYREQMINRGELDKSLSEFTQVDANKVSHLETAV